MTKQIQLAHSKVAVIDDEDFALVSGYKWHASKGRHTYYAIAHIKNSEGKWTTIAMHQLILGSKPGELTDHKDRNGLNNTRLNIRPCTRQQNLFNQTIQVRAGKSSEYKGVHLNRNKWQARIGVDCKDKFIGNFDNEIDAARAYDEAAKKYHGEFASLNFPEGQTQ